MTIYLLIYGILAFLSIFNLYVRQKQRQVLLLFGVILVVLFQALRWRTGTDWNSYLNEFLYVNNPNHNDQFEIGYQLLNSVIRHITDKYTIFLLVECGLNALFIILFLRSMPINNRNFAFLYFFSLAIFPIRYTLASNIILCSYIFIAEKKFLPFLITVLLAFSIHRMTILFLPAYFVVNRMYPFKFLLIIYFGAILIGYATEMVFGNLLQFAALIYGGVGDEFQGKLNAYITEEIPEYGEISPFRFLLSIINSTLFILIFYYFKKKYFQSDRLYNMLFNLYVLGISFNRLVIQTIPDLARLTSLFTGGFIIMILMVLSQYKRDKQVLITAALICYFLISYNSSINGIYQDLFVPYYSVFSDSVRANVY